MADEKIILIADIGGTNARFALSTDGVLASPITLPVSDYPNSEMAIAAAMEHFERSSLAAAYLAVAGPIRGEEAKLTNGSWIFRAAEISNHLGGVPVRLFNDVQAAALALPRLAASDSMALGQDRAINKAFPLALLSVGTGLGISCYLPNGTALATEAGHASLPATTRDEWELVAKLQARFGHLSCERLLSGDGLSNLHQVMTGAGRREPGDIVELALADNKPEKNALSQFCSFLGATAGDLALIYGAWGGVFIGGGVPIRFTEFLKQSGFRQRFEAKGRFEEILSEVPTRLITRTDIGLLGLANFDLK